MLGNCGLMRSSIVTVASELNAEEMVLQQNNHEKTKLSANGWVFFFLAFFAIGKKNCFTNAENRRRNSCT